MEGSQIGSVMLSTCTFSMPFAPASWSLKVRGLVARLAVFSLAQLMRLPRIAMRVQHRCVEGSAVTSWHGVRLNEIAKLVGISQRVTFVEFRSIDSNYGSSWHFGRGMHPQTLLAYGMNGHTLYPDHEAPLRVYSAVKLGHKHVKY